MVPDCSPNGINGTRSAPESLLKTLLSDCFAATFVWPDCLAFVKRDWDCTSDSTSSTPQSPHNEFLSLYAGLPFAVYLKQPKRRPSLHALSKHHKRSPIFLII